MRIALITDGIMPFVTGGMQKHSSYIAKYFTKNKWDGEGKKEETKKGIKEGKVTRKQQINSC